jgi:hypothetical protein
LGPVPKNQGYEARNTCGDRTDHTHNNAIAVDCIS